MRILLALCLSLAGCGSARFAAEDRQCKQNNTVDGIAIGTLIATPLFVVAPPAVAVGAGALMGGSYFVTHEALCDYDY